MLFKILGVNHETVVGPMGCKVVVGRGLVRGQQLRRRAQELPSRAKVAVLDADCDLLVSPLVEDGEHLDVVGGELRCGRAPVGVSI